MTNLLPLLRVDLARLFGLNKFYHSGGRRGKLKAAGVAAGVLLLAVLMLGSVLVYCLLFGQGFAALGKPELLITTMVVACSLVALIFAICQGNALFGARDDDQLFSLPIPFSSIAASRILRLYGCDLGLSLLILLPAGGVYDYLTGAGPWFWARLLVGTVFVPMIPVLLGGAGSVLVAWAASRMRHRNLVTTILTVLLVVAAMSFSFLGKGDIDYQNLANLVETQLGSAYPPAGLFTAAVAGGDLTALAVFLLVSLVFFALFCLGVGKLLRPLHARLLSGAPRAKAKAGTKEDKGRTHTPFGALLIKEFRLLLSSATYLTNSAIGAILLLLAAVASLFVPPETLLGFLGPQEVQALVLPMFPLAVSFFTVMTLPSAAAISLEGHHLELLKSFPLKVSTILGAKCAMALLVTLPPTLVSSAILCHSLKLSWAITVASLVIPALYSLFISAAGLLINLRFPRFDWTSEAQVVKQSASMGITIGVGLVSVGVPFVLISMNPAGALTVLWGFAAALAVLTAAVWAVLTLWGPRRFQKLTLN